MKALPGRSWMAIAQYASLRKIKRKRLRCARPVHPILAELRAAREAQRFTRPDLSNLTGYHVNDILKWETGKARPRLDRIQDIAEALGYEIILRRKTRPDEVVIPFPAKARLMAGRA